MKMLTGVALAIVLALGMPGFAAADEAEILKAHFKAVGGLEKLSEIKTVTRSGDVKMGGAFGDMAGTFKEVAVVGKKSFSEMDLVMFAETTRWNGTSGWKTNSMEGTTALSGDDLNMAKAAVFLDPLQSTYEQYGRVAFQQAEDETIRDRDCVALSIVGTELKFYVDRETHHVSALKIQINDPDLGEAQVLVYYSDYAEYGGVMLPNSIDIDIADGMITIEYDYSKTEIDTDVNEKIFEKP